MTAAETTQPDEATAPVDDDRSPVRVLLVDDHNMLREGVRRSLEANGIDVVAEAGDGEEGVRLALELVPDVVLMDVSMPLLGGVEATRQVRTQLPDVRVVMLTMHADDVVVQEAIRAGADGYLVKDCSSAELTETIRAVAAGTTTVSPELAASMLREARRFLPATTTGASGPEEDLISKREEEVLQLIADGCSTPEVAEQLYISAKTVKNHLASIYAKLDTRDRTQAVLRAVRMGIIRLD